MKLPTAEEMRRLDHSASHDYGIPSIVLMENAGLGTVLMMERELGPPGNAFALIFVGPGNNGGDGLVIGRHLHQRGCQPVFFFLVGADSLRGDAAINLNIIEKLHLPFHVIDTPDRVKNIPFLYREYVSRGLTCYALVDAIFGIGLTRPITGHFADAVNIINQQGFSRIAPVIAVDVPSGLSADTGNILGCCVRADFTATYGFAKPGHFIHGTTWTGKLAVIDIGIPPEAAAGSPIATELATAESFAAMGDCLHRKIVSHKGSHGHLLLVAGSVGKTGAAVLAARGALYAGAGLVSLAVPTNLNQVFEIALPEAMTIPLPGSGNFFNSADLEMIAGHSSGKSAMVIGPGIGQEEVTAELVLALYRNFPGPMVIDADALNILAAHRDRLPVPYGARIFTPHPGEISRLLCCSVGAIDANRLDAARQACELFAGDHHDTVLVLKGAGTITVSSGGRTIINTSGNPGMASGGMGDVLSGVIGALLCQGMPPWTAAAAGVYLHGVAADILLGRRGVGYLAGELARELPLARKKLQREWTDRFTR